MAFWLVRASGKSGLITDVLIGFGLGGFGLYLLAACPLLVPIYGPGITAYIALALFLARRRAEFLRKLVILGVVLVVAVCLRWPWYILGLFSDTAPHLFPEDFSAVYKNSNFISIVFLGSQFGRAGPILVVASALGAVSCLRRTGDLRIAAYALLLMMASLAGAGAALLVAHSWILPPPIYLEMSVWPLYAVFTAVALHRAARFVASPFRTGDLGDNCSTRLEWIVPLPAAMITMALVMSQAPTPMGFPFPPRAPGIVDILRATIALGPASRFNGRIATIIPVHQDSADPWS